MLESTFLFLKGIGESTERQLWEQGIVHWHQFLSAVALPGVSGKRKELYNQDLTAAIQHFERKNYQFFAQALKPRDHWRLFETLRHRTMFLDIETDGAPIGLGQITLVGMYCNNTMTILIAGESLTEERLHHELSQADLLVTFFGTGFDVPYLRASFPRIPMKHAHFDLCFAARRMGLRGGLKSIEHTVGLERPSDIQGLNGWDAVILWEAWLKGDRKAKERLCDYNEADVRNLEPLAEHIYSYFYDHYGPPNTFYR